MSDTQDTPNAELPSSDLPEESQVELSDDSLVEEVDISADSEGEASEQDDLVDLDGQKLSKKELSELVAKRDNLMKDYTQKTMALAEESKKVAQLAEQREEAIRKAGEFSFSKQREIDEFNAIDWEAVAAERPEDFEKIYARAQIAHLKNLREHQAAQEHREQLIQQRTDEEVQEALRAIPELKSPEFRQKFLSDAAEYLKQYDLGPEVVSNHKAVKMIRDAIADRDDAKKYREIVNKAKSKARQNAQSNAPEPPTQTRSVSPSKSGLSDDLSTDEWVKRREAQLRGQRKR